MLMAVFLVWQAVVQEECMPPEQFVAHLLPSLLSLASDPVPNVRVLLAKALKQTLLEKGTNKETNDSDMKRFPGAGSCK